MPDPFRPDPEVAAAPKTPNSHDLFASSIKTYKYTPINTPTFVPLEPPPSIPWNPRSLSTSDDEEALVRENFPSPYDRKVYENGHRKMSGKEKAKFGWQVVLLIIVVVLAILGVGAGVTIKLVRV